MTQTTPPIEVTSKAASQIGKILASEAPGALLRVSVSGGGCSGFQYGFEIDTQTSDQDLVIEKDGIKVAIDDISVTYMEGSVIDYVTDLIGSSFQVKNPLVQSECGCGTSFSI
ncbi:MAG: iron-sulfur cluster insertion protein ErpA [Alphaproteobacteria bacterium]|nr:MAG: iron-sulfur cluster insertion protein ErpA [Alphaproteobacteria bacterium]